MAAWSVTEPATPTAAPVVWAWLTSLMGWQIAGMPAGGVLFALLMAWLNGMDKATPGQPWHKHARSVLFQALCGCLVALALIKLPFFKGYGVAELGFSAAAPLVTLAIPWVRNKAEATASKVLELGLDWLRRKLGAEK